MFSYIKATPFPSNNLIFLKNKNSTEDISSSVCCLHLMALQALQLLRAFHSAALQQRREFWVWSLLG